MDKTVTPEIFGDAKIFPVINSLVDIFNERDDDFQKKELRYCMTKIKEYHEISKKLNVLDKTERVYFLNLLISDFKNSIESAKLTENVKTHLTNLIVGFHRETIRTFIKRKY